MLVQLIISKFKTSNMNYNNLYKIFIIAIVAVFVINVGIILADKNAAKEKIDSALELNRPANVSLTVIKDSSCTDCADILPFVSAIKNTNVKIIKEETFEAGSAEAKDLINKFGIQKLPSFVITGEINKNEGVKKLLSQIGLIKDDTFKLTYFIAPYLDLASNEVRGKVTATFITDKTCTECYDINPFKQILSSSVGMTKPNVVTLDRGDKDAQVLINRYKIQSVPVFILTGEVSDYPSLTGVWLQIGTLEKDGAWVLRDIKKVNPSLVYRDLTTGQIIKPEAPESTAGNSASSPVTK
jgi:hypothetical protein